MLLSYSRATMDAEIMDKDLPEKTILSIDGGGILTTPSIVVLEEIEYRLGLPISSIFDCIGGTSAGALVALGAAIPEESSVKPKYSMEKLRQTFTDTSQVIFANPKHQISALFTYKYEPTLMKQSLEGLYGEATLSQALSEIVVTAFDIGEWVPHIFTRTQAKTDPRKDLRMSLVAQMSSAAPGFYPPVECLLPGSDTPHAMIDGGIVANNPALTSLVMLSQLYPNTKFQIISLGVEVPSTKRVVSHKDKSWGQIHWLLQHNIFGAFVDGSSSLTDFNLSGLCEALGHSFHRVRIPLDGCSPEPDCVTKKNISALELQAVSWLDNNRYAFDGLMAHLSRNTKSKVVETSSSFSSYPLNQGL